MNEWHAPRYRRDPTAPAAESVRGGGKSPYRLGRAFEYSVKQQLERRDWFVMRSPSSKGRVDLLAVKLAMPALMVQLKRTGLIGSDEWNELCQIAWATGAWPVVCYRPTARTTAYMRLDRLRARGRPGRPWTPFDPATCLPLPVPLRLV